MAQLWGGRFTKETDQLVYNFNASISFDRKFYREDIQGSIAHFTMLAKQGNPDRTGTGSDHCRPSGHSGGCGGGQASDYREV